MTTPVETALAVVPAGSTTSKGVAFLDRLGDGTSLAPMHAPINTAGARVDPATSEDIAGLLAAILQVATKSNAPRVLTTGAITAAYNAGSTLAQNITANAAAKVACDGMSTVSIQVAGAWAGSLTIWGSIDGNGFFPISVKPFGNGTDGPSTTAIVANGEFEVSAANYAAVAVFMSTWTSGAAQVTLAAANGTKVARVTAPASDPLPTQSIATAFVDRSGTTSATTSVATGTGFAFTQLAAANPARQYLRVTNLSQSATLYVYDKSTGTPTASNTIPIPPGVMLVLDSKVSNAAIQLSASAASVAYEAAEG